MFIARIILICSCFLSSAICHANQLSLNEKFFETATQSKTTARNVYIWYVATQSVDQSKPWNQQAEILYTELKTNVIPLYPDTSNSAQLENDCDFALRCCYLSAYNLVESKNFQKTNALFKQYKKANDSCYSFQHNYLLLGIISKFIECNSLRPTLCTESDLEKVIQHHFKKS